jgi:hypothetical protein
MVIEYNGNGMIISSEPIKEREKYATSYLVGEQVDVKRGADLDFFCEEHMHRIGVGGRKYMYMFSGVSYSFFIDGSNGVPVFEVSNCDLNVLETNSDSLARLLMSEGFGEFEKYDKIPEHLKQFGGFLV